MRKKVTTLETLARRYADRTMDQMGPGKGAQLSSWGNAFAGFKAGYHPDYNKPLEIVWVCNEHHRLIHAGALKVLRKQIQVVPVRGKRLP